MVFNARPLRDAEALIARGDYAGASGRLWETVSQSLKAAAHEWTAEGPREMRRLVERFFDQTGDRDLLRLFSVVESVRANATENFMSAGALQAAAEDVQALLEKLANLPGNAAVAGARADPSSPDATIAGRREGFAQRIGGLSRREARREVLAELARVDGEIDSMKPPAARSDTAIPGMPESRIAVALQQLERQPQGGTSGQALQRYRGWLLDLLVRPAT